jgi:hypothetical protein
VPARTASAAAPARRLVFITQPPSWAGFKAATRFVRSESTSNRFGQATLPQLQVQVNPLCVQTPEEPLFASAETIVSAAGAGGNGFDAAAL